MNLFFIIAGTLILVSFGVTLVFAGWVITRIYQADKELQERRKAHRH